VTKLKWMRTGCKFKHAIASRSAVLALAMALAGCPSNLRGPAAGGVANGRSSAVPGAPAQPAPAAGTARHEGRPYDIAAGESLLVILAYRSGALASMGHNHVIASHDVTGTFYVPDNVFNTTFELHLPVAELTIDEPRLRAREGPDFPVEVAESAKEGTRRNMLSEALLGGAQFPEITLISQGMHAGPGTAAPLPGDNAAGSAVADVQVSVRGRTRTLSVPVQYVLKAGRLEVSADLPLKQSELGLTPFSALMGALQVQDEMRVKFQIVALRAQLHGPEN